MKLEDCIRRGFLKRITPDIENARRSIELSASNTRRCGGEPAHTPLPGGNRFELHRHVSRRSGTAV